MTGPEVALILTLLGVLAVLSLGLLWILSRFLKPDGSVSGLNPILGARDRVAIYRPSASNIAHHPHVLIPLTERLKTREEMVEWMTKDLPKLTEQAATSGRLATGRW